MTKDEALNHALQLVSNLRTHSWTVADTQFVITAIKEALAQPEQEPFMAAYEFKQYGYYKDGKGTLKLGNIPATQPPQRTWVGLTDGEIEVIEALKAPPVHPDFIDCDDWMDFARAIEYKLKEKNELR